MQKTKQIALVLTIGALVVVVVWFLANRSSILQTGAEGDITKVSAPASDPIAVPIAYDPTVAATTSKIGWKVYHNSEYGFAFDYPPEYELIDYIEESDRLFSATLAHTKRPKEEDLPGSEAVLISFGGDSFYLSVSVTEGTIPDIISKYSMETYEDASLTNILLNGFSGALITSRDSLSGKFRNDILFSLNNKKVLSVGYMQNTGNDSMHILPNTVFDTVLQSVRPYP